MNEKKSEVIVNYISFHKKNYQILLNVNVLLL